MATIGGREFQHATTGLALGAGGPSVPIESFSKASYKDGAKKKPVHLANGKIKGYTIDNQVTEGSITLLKSEWEIRKAIILAANPGYGIGEIELKLTFTYGNTLASLLTDVVQCLIDEEGRDTDGSSQDALMVTLPLFVLDILPAGGVRFINYLRPGA